MKFLSLVFLLTMSFNVSALTSKTISKELDSGVTATRVAVMRVDVDFDKDENTILLGYSLDGTTLSAGKFIHYEAKVTSTAMTDLSSGALTTVLNNLFP